MIFGSVDTRNSAGSYLAHSLRTRQTRLAKGTLVTQSIVDELIEAGYQEVVVARLEANDVHENDAAEQLANALCGTHVVMSRPRTGRVNLLAAREGLCLFEPERIREANAVNHCITVSTLAENQWVARGRMLATIKIISYAVPATDVQRVISSFNESTIDVHTTTPKRAILIQTRLSATKESMLEKTQRITAERLTSRGAALDADYRCPHDSVAVQDSLREALTAGVDWIFMIGASAISDRADVIPEAIVNCGGQIDRYGIPVDPGNLLLLAHHGSTRIIGLPGCARSARYNGLDMIIDRLACNVVISDAWLNGLSVGGLLNEVADRPEPRSAASGQQRVSALLLAAGSSRRAGSINKLLAPYRGSAMITQVARTLKRSAVQRVLAVTGFEHERVSTALTEAQCEHHHNPKYASGMASSLVAGLSQLTDCDAVIVCLGDMPHVSPASLDALIAAYQDHEDKLIFVPVYQGQRGNPVLFTQAFFDTLLSLEGDIGARRLLREYPDQVLEVDVPDKGILQDYDTEVELSQLAP